MQYPVVITGISPDQMTPQERITEVARILAAGVVRMHAKSSSLSAPCGDSSLGLAPAKSVSRTRGRPRVAAQTGED